MLLSLAQISSETKLLQSQSSSSSSSPSSERLLSEQTLTYTPTKMLKQLPSGESQYMSLITHYPPQPLKILSLNEQLWLAIENNDIFMVKHLVYKAGCDPNYNKNNKHNKTILYRACELNLLDIVKYLILVPHLNPNIGNKNGITPLYIACYHGYTSIVKILLSKTQSQTQIVLNKQNKGISKSKSYVKYNIDVNACDKRGFTPLYAACCHDRYDIILLLLSCSKIKINKRTKNNNSVLYAACYFGKLQVVAILLSDKRIDVNQTNDRDATAFLTACQMCGDDSFDYENSNSLINDVPWSDRINIVLLLLADPRVNINKTMDWNISPLWISSRFGHLSVIRHILASNRMVNINQASDYDGLTAYGHCLFQSYTVYHIQQYGDNTIETQKEHQLRTRNCRLIADLLAKYNCDPSTTRTTLRQLPDIQPYFIAEVFTLIVLLCDDYLQPKQCYINDDNVKDVIRFFSITSRLPMDLQMVICNRMFMSQSNHVLSRHLYLAMKKVYHHYQHHHTSTSIFTHVGITTLYQRLTALLS